jgi:hypothetical protein
MIKEDKDYKDSQKELAKINDDIIERLASDVEKKFMAKGMPFKGDELRDYLKRFREGWVFKHEMTPGLVVISWDKHPLLEYKDESSAQVIYKFFKGSFKHVFKQGIMAVIRFFKSIKDPKMLLVNDVLTVKELMIKEQTEEIKMKLLRVDSSASFEVEVTE